MNTNTLTKEKIAIILEPHAQHLADMKARGKSLSELLYWIRNNHGWVLNPAQLERFLKQKESAAQPQADAAATKAQEEHEYRQLMSSPAAPSSMHCQTPRIASGGLAIEYQQQMSSTPTTPSSTHCKIPPCRAIAQSATAEMAPALPVRLAPSPD